MSDATIRCPRCGTPIEIEAAVAQGLREEIRAETLASFQGKERELALGEARLAAQAKSAEQHIAAEVERRGREACVQAEAAARGKVSDEHRALCARAAQAEEEARKAKQTELALLTERDTVQRQKADIPLTVARLLQEERGRLGEEAQKAAYEAYELKFKERDEKEAGLRRTIGELQRKVDQGSMQIQGEVLETSLEELLRREFPGDRFEPVPKGIRGADLVHHVRGAGGADAGVILWESKHTKAWAGDWLAKLRDDQRAIKAEVAALVSQVLPAGAGPMSLVEGVWVAGYACATGLAHLLRKALLDVAASRRSEEGRQEKMGDLYAYLTGPQFKGRVEGLLEPFIAMRQELDAEKRALEKIWARREKQIQRALSNVSGLHGDMEGIVGRALPEIRQLELPAPADDVPCG